MKCYRQCFLVSFIPCIILYHRSSHGVAQGGAVTHARHAFAYEPLELGALLHELHKPRCLALFLKTSAPDKTNNYQHFCN